MNAPEPIVVTGLVKRYGRKVVLRDLDLAVRKGSVTALLGRNGAGKSTLLRILTGLLPASGGKTRVLGIDPTRKAKSVKARVGYVPEQTPFHPRWRVRDVIDLSRAFRRKTWDVGTESRLLDAFSLARNDRIGSLSKGYRAKLALLTALAHRPEVLMLDEPASGLDPIVRREVLASLVDAIHEEGRTVLMSSHLMEDVERLADRVAFLSEGRIVLEGEVEEVRARNGNLEKVFLELLGTGRMETTPEATPCGV